MGASKIFALISVISLLASSLKTSANHLVAGEMRYQTTENPNEYKVGMKLYRNCAGKEICSSCPVSLSPDCQITVQIEGYQGIYANQNFGSASLKIVSKSSAQDIYNPCKMNQSICSNCGTRTPGHFTPGYEMYYFEGIVNLNAVPSNCCEVKISYQSCCRNNTLTNLINPNLTNYYQEIMINKCLQKPNNSPAFSSDPIYFVCAGTDVTLNLGNATDPDNDSLSFEKSPLLAAANMPVQFLSPYSDSVPFPYFDAPANPTKGIYLNPITGELKFRPMGSFSSNLCIKISKWRKINQTYQKIGFVTRELNIHTFFCENNNPPTILTYNKENQLTTPQPSKSFILKSEEEFCISFTAKDGTLPSDTTHLTFVGKEYFEKMGAKFKPLYNPNSRHLLGPKYDSIQFCWTPSDTLIKAIPYYLHVHARDQACPTPANSNMSVQFLVSKPLGLNRKNISENFIQISPNPAANFVSLNISKPLEEELTFTILSLDGQLVQTETIEPFTTTKHILLKPQCEGLYFIKIDNSSYHFTAKLLINGL